MNLHILLDFPANLPDTIRIVQNFGSCMIVYECPDGAY